MESTKFQVIIPKQLHEILNYWNFEKNEPLHGNRKKNSISSDCGDFYLIFK